MNDLTTEYLEFEEVLQNSKSKVLADMLDSGRVVPSFDGLDLRQKYAEATMGWIHMYDPKNELPGERWREIAARFWQYGKRHGFTEESFSTNCPGQHQRARQKWLVCDDDHCSRTRGVDHCDRGGSSLALTAGAGVRKVIVPFPYPGGSGIILPP